MELDEVAARVVRSYWVLLTAMTVLPLTLVALWMSGREPAAVAHARLQAGGAAADAAAGEAGASVLVSQVKAFATSESLLTEVLREQRVDRSARKVAKAVEVTGLGTSNVVELSVKDRDPGVAQRLTDAIAIKVVRQLTHSGQDAIRAQLDEIDERIGKLEDKLGPLARRAGGPAPDIAAANERERVQSELSGLRSNRSDLLTQLTAAGSASVVQHAVPAPRTDPTVMMAAIAGLAGLVGGVLIAVVAEMVRPTIPGQRRVARRLGVPLLGWADRGPAQLADLGRRVRLAAKKEDVGRVTLVGAPGPLPPSLVSAVASAVYGDETRPVRTASAYGTAHRGASENAEDAGDGPSLNSDGPGGRSGTSVVRSGGGTALMATKPGEVSPSETTQPVAVRRACHVHAFEDIDPGADDTVGVVVVVGRVTTVAGLETVRDLVAASGWPLLGVVATSRKATTRMTARRPAQGRETEE
ncbi:hypothetical protein E1200_32475 [Actinomadura sp. GC306]|uniref:hypothetical protein n=1 Tax=Actinomadura sp. GC306 TaxID=2530367 RepID=UPI0010446274|nr:hypothetical protein [Actinomadura sp. GC306]TDC59132.1 hypothetical protein E1200_32475 [Actinomadura sp. GC306]